jgi:hypothetical protein
MHALVMPDAPTDKHEGQVVWTGAGIATSATAIACPFTDNAEDGRPSAADVDQDRPSVTANDQKQSQQRRAGRVQLFLESSRVDDKTERTCRDSNWWKTDRFRLKMREDVEVNFL